MKTAFIDQDIQTVTTFAASLAGAAKNYALYPHDHSMARKHATKVHTELKGFLARHDCLRLSVDRNRLLYDGEPILEGDMTEGNIAFLLARDGLEWIEFASGIEQWEVQGFLKLVHDYRMIDAENDENIVTVLWERDYPHIRYKAVDILSLDAPTINFSSFKVKPQQMTTTAGASTEGHGISPGYGAAVENMAAATTDATGAEEHEENSRTGPEEQQQDELAPESPPLSIAITAKGNDLWNLTPTEQAKLEAMVYEEEHRDNSNDVTEILLILLVVQNNETDFITVLDFLLERFIRSLRHRQFHLALKIVKNLKRIRTSFATKRKWALSLLDNFFNTISRPESLRDITKFFLEKQQETDESQLQYLWAVLRLLSPAVLATIAPLTKEIRSDHLAQPIFDLITFQGQQKPATLAHVVDQLDERTCERLIPFIEQMMINDASRVLTAMTRHPVYPVRKRALDLLIEWDILILADLFPLLNDPNQGLREKVLTLIGRKRDPEIERLMLDYLEQENCTVQSRDHLLACYKALGQCGSHRCIPFLQHILMQRRLNTMFAMGGSVHKEGAARALHALRLQKANHILQEGGRSMMPDTRGACRKVIGR